MYKTETGNKKNPRKLQLGRGKCDFMSRLFAFDTTLYQFDNFY